MSPKDLDDILYEDALNAWELYQKGMAGPTTTYINGYNTYAMLNKISEILIATNSKNYKTKPPEKFDKVFEEQYRILTLNDGISRNKLSTGTQAALALEGAPKWINELAQQEIQDGSTGYKN